MSYTALSPEALLALPRWRPLSLSTLQQVKAIALPPVFHAARMNYSVWNDVIELPNGSIGFRPFDGFIMPTITLPISCFDGLRARKLALMPDPWGLLICSCISQLVSRSERHLRPAPKILIPDNFIQPSSC